MFKTLIRLKQGHKVHITRTPPGAPRGSSGAPPGPLRGVSLEGPAAEPWAGQAGRSPLPPTLLGTGDLEAGVGVASELQPLTRNLSVMLRDEQKDTHSPG